jgi:tetratricopeptide (TPR) repeat protein
MEKDLNERKKRKTQDLKNAEELKLKGNDYMKKGEYDYAVMKYSQALELVKDIKAIWLNRALAYLKLKKFRKAISDCTKVLDYSECFENGFTASRESCFKAFLRRGTAFKERKDYE